MPRRRKPPEPLPIPKRTTPHPKRCPRCASRKIVDLGVTPGGVYPWTCRACRAIGYDDRIVGDPVAPGAERAPRGPRGTSTGRTFIKRQGRAVDREDVP